MNYFLFKIRSADPGPMWLTQGEFFWKYRWGVAEDFFLLQEKDLLPGPKPGDMLFIAMDGALLGYTELVRVEEGLLGYRPHPVQELWVRGDRIVVSPRMRSVSTRKSGALPAKVARGLIANATTGGIVYAKNEDP